jgi:hypothetical protein
MLFYYQKIITLFKVVPQIDSKKDLHILIVFKPGTDEFVYKYYLGLL